MSEKTYKSRCVEKFAPNKKYRDSWDRIFSHRDPELEVKFPKPKNSFFRRFFNKTTPSPGSEDAQELGSP